MKRLLAFASISAVALSATGCVERRMTVVSDVPNALVKVDGQEIGHTPVSTSFTYYGDRQIQLIKDGYETKTVNQRIAPPWYQLPGLDFVSEVLWPYRIRDERRYQYSLEPSVQVSNDQLMVRAQQVLEDGRNPPAEILRKAKVSNVEQVNEP